VDVYPLLDISLKEIIAMDQEPLDDARAWSILDGKNRGTL
jgi:hypothetical protein